MVLSSSLPRPVVDALFSSGVFNPSQSIEVNALEGGVSSSVWRVQSGPTAVCVKQSLGQLRVEAEWFASTERLSHEVAWLKFAHKTEPGSVPEVLYFDEKNTVLIMSYLDPSMHSLWKTALIHGETFEGMAEDVARRLSIFHRASANDPLIQCKFEYDEFFNDLRIDPYFGVAAERNPDVAFFLRPLSDGVLNNKVALMHGDVSPKNLFWGPEGAIFLDAECACYGDPAFDVAFLLSHLILKLWNFPQHAALISRDIDTVISVYFAGVTWELASELEVRVAQFLLGLLLARADGKSPIEYWRSDTVKIRLKEKVKSMMRAAPLSLNDTVESIRRSR